MKIELIGTGSIFSASNSACSLLNDKILVDIPNGACKALIKGGHNLQEIDYCVITHLHGDHIFDIPFFLLDGAKKGKREKPFVMIGVKGIEEHVKTLVELAFKGKWEMIKENMKLEFMECEELNEKELTNGMKISSVLVEHSSNIISYGYILSSDGLSVGFTGDCKLCDGVYQLLEKSDILVTDMTYEKGTKSHMGIDNITELAKKYTNKTLVTTHMGDETKLIASKIKAKNIIIPSDGFAIELQKVKA